MYSGYGIAFDWKGSWSFNDDFARNSIVFGVDNSSSSHTDNLKNNFLILSEGDTSKKNVILILLKQRQNFVCVCIITVIIVIYF